MQRMLQKICWWSRMKGYDRTNPAWGFPRLYQSCSAISDIHLLQLETHVFRRQATHKFAEFGIIGVPDLDIKRVITEQRQKTTAICTEDTMHSRSWHELHDMDERLIDYGSHLSRMFHLSSNRSRLQVKNQRFSGCLCPQHSPSQLIYWDLHDFQVNNTCQGLSVSPPFVSTWLELWHVQRTSRHLDVYILVGKIAHA
jgi:hypothetical protein